MWVDLRSQWEQTPVAANSIAGVVSAVLLVGTGDTSFADVNVSIDAFATKGDGAITIADILCSSDAAAPQFAGSADVAGAVSVALLQGTGAITSADIAGPLDAARLQGDGAVISADICGPISSWNITNLSTTTDFTWADISGVVSATQVQGDGAVNFADVAGLVDAVRLTGDGALASASVSGIVDAVLANSLIQLEGSWADVTVSLDTVQLSSTLTAVTDQAGGTPPQWYYDFSSAFERLHMESLKARRKREEDEADALTIAKGDAVQAEIATRLHAEIARQEELDDIQRLKRLVLRYSDTKELPDRVQQAFDKAKEEQTFSRLQALQREFARMLEEEEVAILLILNEED